MPQNHKNEWTTKLKKNHAATLGVERAWIKGIIERLPDQTRLPFLHIVSFRNEGFNDRSLQDIILQSIKEDYRKFITDKLMNSYFDNSVEEMVSFSWKSNKLNSGSGRNFENDRTIQETINSHEPYRLPYPKPTYFCSFSTGFTCSYFMKETFNNVISLLGHCHNDGFCRAVFLQWSGARKLPARHR
jgi:hypothetical protein